jgi:hypothetical protein
MKKLATLLALTALLAGCGTTEDLLFRQDSRNYATAELETLRTVVIVVSRRSCDGAMLDAIRKSGAVVMSAADAQSLKRAAIHSAGAQIRNGSDATVDWSLARRNANGEETDAGLAVCISPEASAYRKVVTGRLVVTEKSADAPTKVRRLEIPPVALGQAVVIPTSSDPDSPLLVVQFTPGVQVR